MSDQTKYIFNAGYQQRVVSLLLRDPAFLSNYGDVVNPAFFDDPILTSITRIAVAFHQTHGVPPSKDSLLEEYRRFCNDFRVQEADRQRMLSAVDSVYGLDLLDGEAIAERVVEFGRRQGMRGAILQSIELMSKDGSDLEDISRMVQGALHIGTGTRSLGFDFFRNIGNLTKLATTSNAYDPRMQILTGFPGVDKATMGGPGIKQVWLVMAKSGVGKSTWCVNAAAAAVKQGYAVVYITIADLQEIDVAVRFAARFTGCTIEQVLRDDLLFQQRSAALAKWQNYLKIRYWPAGTCDVSMIRSYLSKLIAVDNIVPRVLVVDYPSKMKGVHNDSGSGYAGLGKISDGLNAIANDFNVLVYTPSQVNRWSPTGEDSYITGDNIQDSKIPYDNADGAISLNQTPAESVANPQKVRLWVDKVRRGRAKFALNLSFDPYTMMMNEVA